MSDDQERIGDQGQRLSYTGTDTSGAGVRSRAATASMGTTAGKGLGAFAAAQAGGADSDMPKQNPGEDAGAFGERLRVYREKKRDAQQKTALRSMP